MGDELARASESATGVVIADGHEVMRAGLRTMLERFGSMRIVGEASDGRSLVQLVRELSPQIAIVDAMLPLLNGIDATHQITMELRNTRVIVCSASYKPALIEQALHAGASAFLLKSSASIELEIAVGAVLRGEVYLSPKAAEMVVDRYIRRVPNAMPPLSNISPREREVLALLAEGKSNKEISVAMNISVRTVEAHRLQLMEKLNIRSVAELTKYAIREGITSLDL
jgi:DNA-binding NarL/FixJ family response regulator